MICGSMPSWWRGLVRGVACAVVACAMLGGAAGPTAAQQATGWFPLPAPPDERWVPTDVVGLSDGSLVLAYQSGRVWRYAGRGWDRIRGLRATGLAAAPGDGLLAASWERNAVLAWRPGQARPERFAGGREGFGGDGGPALLASLALGNGTSSMAVLGDGGVLIADSGNERVRLVDPAGTITTVAGTGRAGSRGDGGPATAAQLDAPVAVATLPDGGYLIAQASGRRLRRVAPDGTISTAARPGPEGPSDVTAAGAGVFVANSAELWQLEGDDRVRLLDPVDFALRGPGASNRRSDGCTEAVGTDAGGGLLTAGFCGTVWYRPAATTPWPLVALRGARVNRRGIRVAVANTHAGVGIVELLRGGRPVARAERQLAAGAATLSRRAQVPDGWYRLRVTVGSAAGVAHDGVWVHPLRRLSVRNARRLLSPHVESVMEDETVFLGGRCRAFGRRRVDCEVRVNYIAWGARSECQEIVSLRIRKSGVPELRSYRCARNGRAQLLRRPRSRWWSDRTALTPGRPDR